MRGWSWSRQGRSNRKTQSRSRLHHHNAAKMHCVVLGSLPRLRAASWQRGCHQWSYGDCRRILREGPSTCSASALAGTACAMGRACRADERRQHSAGEQHRRVAERPAGEVASQHQAACKLSSTGVITLMFVTAHRMWSPAIPVPASWAEGRNSVHTDCAQADNSAATY